MRTSDGYRFSLGWCGNSVEKRAVGELLEALSNRKSDLVVQAVWEYIQAHPEIVQPNTRVVISVHATPTDDHMLAKIQSMIEASLQKKLENINLVNTSESVSEAESGPTEADLDDMLSNLEIFNQQP